MTEETKESKIEKETFLQKINPYYGSLKYFVKNGDKKPRRAFFEGAFLALAPAGAFYFLKEENNLRKKIALKKGEEFNNPQLNYSEIVVSPILELAKIGMAYYISSLHPLF